MKIARYLIPLLCLSACYRDALGGPADSSGSSEGMSDLDTDGLGMSDTGIMTTTWESSAGTSAADTGGGDSGSSGGGGLSDSGSTGTPEPASKCGTKEQECEEGSDSCTADCTLESRYVFITSAIVPGNMAGSFPDVLCEDAANTACSGGGPCMCAGDNQGLCTFKALIMRESGSSSFWAPIDGFIGRYKLPNGDLIAEGLNGLKDPIKRPNQNEWGDEITGWAWTGLDASEDTLDNCCHNEWHIHWSSASPDGTGWVGLINGAGDAWVNIGPMVCDFAVHLYCVQVAG